jgi:hypothetical protein
MAETREDYTEDKMRHALLNRTAQIIDRFVDTHKRVRRRTTFPHKEISEIISMLFPGSSREGRGAFKSVHVVYSRSRTLVLKTSNPRNIRTDLRAYKRIPETVRNRYFGKIYWGTKYCLLQKYGREVRVPESALLKLKSIGKAYGLKDIRPANIRKINGRFKIIDALPS